MWHHTNFLKWLLRFLHPYGCPSTIWRALLVHGESKVINHLIHREYELTNTSRPKLQKKYHVSRNKIYTTIKGKGRPTGSQCRQKAHIKKPVKPEVTISTPSLEFVTK